MVIRYEPGAPLLLDEPHTCLRLPLPADTEIVGEKQPGRIEDLASHRPVLKHHSVTEDLDTLPAFQEELLNRTGRQRHRW